MPVRWAPDGAAGLANAGQLARFERSDAHVEAKDPRAIRGRGFELGRLQSVPSSVRRDARAECAAALTLNGRDVATSTAMIVPGERQCRVRLDRCIAMGVVVVFQLELDSGGSRACPHEVVLRSPLPRYRRVRRECLASHAHPHHHQRLLRLWKPRNIELDII